eukprot:INCI14068.2.p1 GENE.INCI14068.2~~INCI14068.2.p1  ORF type:complete len:557 (+),score=75.65 INCI14068.2:577-2247(+)
MRRLSSPRALETKRWLGELRLEQRLGSRPRSRCWSMPASPLVSTPLPQSKATSCPACVIIRELVSAVSTRRGAASHAHSTQRCVGPPLAFFSQIVENPPLDKLTERALRGGASNSPTDIGNVDQPDAGPRSDSPPETPHIAAPTALEGLNASCSCFVNTTSLGTAEPVPAPPKIDRDAAKRYRYGCAATTLCHKPVDDSQLLLALDAGDRDSIGTGRKRWWRLAENKLFMTLASAALEARKAAGLHAGSALKIPARPTRWFDVTGPQSSSERPRERLEGKLLNRVDFVKSTDAANVLTAGPPGLDPKSRRLPLATVGGGALHFSFKRGLPPLSQPPGVSVAGLNISPSVFPDLSIEVWVNLDENSFAAGGPDLALPNSGFAVGCGDYATGLGRRAILLHDSHFSAIGRPHVAIDAGAPYLSNLDPLAPRNWHHIVAVWQQGGFSFVYVNGVQRSVASTFTTNSECNMPLWVGHTAFTPTISSSSPNMTTAGYNANLTNSSEARAKSAGVDGKEEVLPADFGSGLEGFIGLVRVFGRTLSAVEVQTLFQRGEQRFPD